MAEEYMLTTVDNKWNPFTQFKEWLNYDNSMGYNTLGLLANFALSDYENAENDQNETNKAVDTILMDPLLGSFYRKVTRESFKTTKVSANEQDEAEKDQNSTKNEKEDEKSHL